MGLKGKITVEKEVKCNGDVFRELIRQKPHDIANAAPDHCVGGGFHEGEEDGAFWEYIHAGKKEAIKVKYETLGDDEKNSARYIAIEGDVLKLYKKWVVTVQVDKSAGDAHVIKWIIEYEKVSEEVAEPLSYVEFFINLSKAIEAYHAQIENVCL